MDDQVKDSKTTDKPTAFDELYEEYGYLKLLIFKMLGSCLIFAFVFILVNFFPTTSGEWWGA